MQKATSYIYMYSLVVGALLWWWATPAVAVPAPIGFSLREVVVTQENPTEMEVLLRLNATPEFSAYKLANPDRLMVDLRGADVSQVIKPEPQGAWFTQLTTSQIDGERGRIGRVVLGFTQSFSYESKLTPQGLLLKIKTEQTSTALETENSTVVEISSDDILVKKATKLLKVTARNQSGGTVLRLKTNGEVPQYELNEIDNPKRLVVDLFDIYSPKYMKTKAKGQAIAKVRIGQHNQKTRIVVDMKQGQMPKYDVASTDEGLVLVFAKPTEVTRRHQQYPLALGDLKVKSEQGFDRIELALQGGVAVRTLSNSPLEKVIALEGVSLPYERPVRHKPNSGAIEYVELSPDPEGRNWVRMGVRSRNPVEHRIWQENGKLFWDTRAEGMPVAQATTSGQSSSTPRVAAYQQATQEAIKNLATAQRRFRGKRITIDLLDADIRNVLRFLSDVSGKNIVVAEGVTGTVTLKLKNIPWDQALAVILRVKGLGMEQKGSIIRVATLAQLQAEEEAEAATAKLREESLPLTTRLIPVNYAVATNMLTLVTPILSPRGSATVDPRTNVIVVNDLRYTLEKVERLIRTLDTQTPQILIEARMIEATNDFATSIGIQWGGGILMSQAEGNPTGLFFPNNVGVVGANDSLLAPGQVTPTNYAVNLPSQDSTAGVGMHLGSVGNVGFLSAKIAAAEANSEAKVISAPKITTMDNQAATITQGIQIPVVINNGLQGISTQFVNAALQLQVTPHVTADGSVLMDVNITNNSPSGATDSFGVPSVSTKAAQTQMLVKDGDTAVIGGIYQRLEKKAMREVPILSKIPVLGWLFKNYSVSDSRSELLVFLTPRVINRRQANIKATVVE
tara:strand:+ start:1443 stop:3992 length:2550 start_codon:yes stop_codon:yes gene_type:complete